MKNKEHPHCLSFMFSSFFFYGEKLIGVELFYEWITTKCRFKKKKCYDLWGVN